jgi:5'-AMP-activated protein kinase, catalytic alpha subunit
VEGRFACAHRGWLAVVAEIFSVTPLVLLVDVKDSGDMIEYQLFCSEELRLALKDIVWATGEDTLRTA